MHTSPLARALIRARARLLLHVLLHWQSLRLVAESQIDLL